MVLWRCGKLEECINTEVLPGVVLIQGRSPAIRAGVITRLVDSVAQVRRIIIEEPVGGAALVDVIGRTSAVTAPSTGLIGVVGAGIVGGKALSLSVDTEAAGRGGGFQYG
jgi:hypothetical protein